MRAKIWAVMGLGLLGLTIAIGAAELSVSAGGAPAGPKYPQRDLGGLAVWNVVRVVGPNRLIVGNGQEQKTLRLWGVADPQESSGQAGGAYSGQTVQFLGNLLAGEQVAVAPGLGEESDQHGPDEKSGLPAVRLFRQPDGLYVNLEVVRQGYGRKVEAELGTEGNLFGAYQERAKLAGKGLWRSSEAAATSSSETSSPTVYVTKSGRKYHREGCEFLSKSKISMTLEEAKKRSYTACRVCRP